MGGGRREDGGSHEQGTEGDEVGGTNVSLFNTSAENAARTPDSIIFASDVLNPFPSETDLRVTNSGSSPGGVGNIQ